MTRPSPAPEAPSLADLRRTPNALASSYSRFRVADRVLLTGHSHQAWPDVSFEAQQQAWLDAARHVDDKWDAAFAVADRVREGMAALLDDSGGHVALGQSTLELVGRLLSGLPLRERPRIVTTDGEFHTLRRLADRLAEEGVEVVRVPAHPTATLAERLAARVDDRTACAAVSSVLFATAEIVPHLRAAAEACARHGAELLVDAYHSVNVAPLSVRQDGLEGAFVVGGGYKYLQFGEGACFLRIPEDCTLRPVLTGWFSEFAHLTEAIRPGAVRYGTGAARFAGSTYDPTAHYRAAAVLDFFRERGLAPALLREVSQHQVGRLLEGIRRAGPDPRVLAADDLPLEARGGFLALRAPQAREIVRRLGERGVQADCRGEVLRLGPAPYLSDAQLDEAALAVADVAASL